MRSSPHSCTGFTRDKTKMANKPKESPYRRGIQLFEEGQTEEAAHLFSEALAEEETSDRWNDWATAQLTLHCPTEAERGYRRALEMNPNFGQAAANLGVLLAGQERFGEAIPFLEQGAGEIDEQQRAAVLGLLKECRQKQPAPPAGPTKITPQEASKPTNGTIDNHLLKLILETLSQHAKALHLLTQRVLILDQRLQGTKQALSPQQAHQRGVHLFQKGKYQDAVLLLNQAVEKEETSTRWNDLARAQLACNRAAEAERGYYRALALTPENNDAAINLGILLAGLKRYGEAIPFLERDAARIDDARRTTALKLLVACRAKLAESGENGQNSLPAASIYPVVGPKLSLIKESDPSHRIQGARMKRIVFSGDFLRTGGAFDHAINIRSLHTILNYPVSLAVKDAKIETVLRGSHPGAIDRSRVYELNGFSENLEDSLTLMAASEISESSAVLLKTPFEEAVVFGFESPEVLLRLFNHYGIPYLDFITHPVRFLDDIFFGIRTNIPEAFAVLEKHALGEEQMYLQAQLHKTTLQRAEQPPIEENSCLFIEPQRDTPWLMEDGRLYDVADFTDEILRIASQYHTIYFRPHPYFETTKESTLDLLRRAGRVIIPDCKLYDLLAHDNIKEVVGLVSSALYEARYFGKTVTHLLKKKRYKIYGLENTAFDPWTYVPIYDAFYNPRFWAEVLQSVCEVRDCPEISLPRKTSRLRTCFHVFWGYNALDAEILLGNVKGSGFNFCQH